MPKMGLYLYNPRILANRVSVIAAKTQCALPYRYQYNAVLCLNELGHVQ